MPATVDLTPERLTGPLGRALASGRLVATMRSKVSGEHITLRFSAKRPPEGRGRWSFCPLEDARKVFVDVPRPDLGTGSSIGSFNGPWGPDAYFWNERGADAARIWTALKLANIAIGESELETDQYEVLIGSACLRCGRALTDPVSIERGIGPECYGAPTGSRHQVAEAARAIATSAPRAVEAAAAPAAAADDLPTGCAHCLNRISGRTRALCPSHGDEWGRDPAIRTEVASAEVKLAVRKEAYGGPDDDLITLPPLR